jgi:tripartite-type tricarboxylate transporter receptor subunit TctC
VYYVQNKILVRRNIISIVVILLASAHSAISVNADAQAKNFVDGFAKTQKNPEMNFTAAL